MNKKIIPFIEKMWSLTPQPIKRGFKTRVKELIKRDKIHLITSKYFDNDEFINGKHITWQQWKVLLLIDKGHKKITVKTGHGVGKDALIAWINVWYLHSHNFVNGMCVAPTNNQIFDVAVKENEKWIRKMYCNKELILGSKYLRVIGLEKESFIKYSSTQCEEVLGGRCSENILTTVNEASGIKDIVFRIYNNCYTEQNDFIILFSNPTKNEGYFYNTHRSKKYKKLTLSSAESPLVSPAYVKKMADRYGKDSDEYGIRILGKFPKDL